VGAVERLRPRVDLALSAIMHQGGTPVDPRDAGFDVAGTFAVESFAAWLPELGGKLANPEYRELLLAAIRKVVQDLPLLGISPHFMTVGRRS